MKSGLQRNCSTQGTSVPFLSGIVLPAGTSFIVLTVLLVALLRPKVHFRRFSAAGAVSAVGEASALALL